MLISVKLVDGLTQEYEFDGAKTVAQFKEFLSEQTGLQPEQIGLIYKGQGLRDADVCSFFYYYYYYCQPSYSTVY